MTADHTPNIIFENRLIKARCYYTQVYTQTVANFPPLETNNHPAFKKRLTPPSPTLHRKPFCQNVHAPQKGTVFEPAILEQFDTFEGLLSDGATQ